MQVSLITPRGFCFGVKRALQMLDEVVALSSKVYVLHEIVHNSAVVEAYRQKGVHFVDRLEDVPDGATVVFSAHGVSKQIAEQAKAKNLDVVDTTCPFVARVHTWVSQLEAAGRQIILIGKEGHAETQGTLGQLSSAAHAWLINSVQQVSELPAATQVGIATQTTLSKDDTDKIIKAIQARYPDCALQTGICKATTERQEALKAACLTHDTVLVVGDKKSSNANRLVELAKVAVPYAYLIENLDEVEGLKMGKSVAITAAASAPESIVQAIYHHLKNQ